MNRRHEAKFQRLGVWFGLYVTEKSIFCVRTEKSGAIRVYVAHSLLVFHTTRYHKL